MRIKERFKRDTIRFGAIGSDQKWKAKAERRSNRNMTMWEELMVAKC